MGVLDLVASLQWVHDNIANFGGDPGNVTIMGQSGGGAKVCDVISMPSAKGLVHKGVALSGNATSATDPASSKAVGAAILKTVKGDVLQGHRRGHSQDREGRREEAPADALGRVL